MSKTETTCLDYLMDYRITGREEKITKQYYLEHGVSEEMIDNATNLLNGIEKSLNENNCNLTTCRYNQSGTCTNEEKRKECVEVSKRVCVWREKIMPPKEIENGKIYYEIDGELKPLEIRGTITLEDCEDIVSDVDSALSNTEYFKGGEMTFKMSRKESKRMKKVLQSIMPRYFTNNWRKTHHLQLIRRRGKRK